MNNRRLLVVVAFLLPVLMASCQCSSIEEKSATIALYSDHGVWDSSVTVGH